MKFSQFKKFTMRSGSVEDYLSRSLDRVLDELQRGLTKLTFGDNIDSFESEEIIFSAGENKNILNKLTTIPSGYIVKWQRGNGLITASSDNEWTITNLYMKNHGSVAVTAKIIFLR